MAVYKETPTCEHCGKPIARAIYRQREPWDNFFGDDFIRWDRWDCDCEEAKKDQKKLKEDIKSIHSEFLTKYKSKP